MSDGADRIRMLLLRADNVLKHGGDGEGGVDGARIERARSALLEARGIADGPNVDGRLGELVDRRLVALDGFASPGAPAGSTGTEGRGGGAG